MIKFVGGLSFEVSGDIENIFSLIVVRLSYTNVFSRTDQWQNNAKFEFGVGEFCIIKQVTGGNDLVEISLSYSENSTASTRTIFQNLVEHYLSGENVQIIKREATICPKCACRYSSAETRQIVENGKTRFFCRDCGELIMLVTAGQQAALSVNQEENIVKNAAKRRVFQSVLSDLIREISHGQQIVPPTCFISYAWGNPAQEAWVKRLVRDLRTASIEVIFDGDYGPSSYLAPFVEKIAEVNCVIVVATPNYLTKHNSTGGDGKLAAIVAAESLLISNIVFGGVNSPQKIFPIILEGTPQLSLPPLLRTIINIKFTDETFYFRCLFELILGIHVSSLSYELIDELRSRVEKI